MRLADRVALVTGAGSGIGRAIALRFAEEGAVVIANDINDAGGRETVRRIKGAGGEGMFVHADVAESREVAQMVDAATEAYGAPQILANVAICGTTAVAENQWAPNVEVGLHGTWLCMQAVLPGMKAMRTGSIINISSVNALMGFGTTHVYCAVKAGIIGLSRSLAGEVGKHGIRVNCICPGTIITEIWQPIIEKDPGILDRIKALYPLGRLGKPEDIANAALFLASDESAFATGAVFVIDGGITATQSAFPAFQAES
ncbi:MAG: SDR family NAD(P)-dependent oxidoreductase [Terriglobia bacterium]